MHFFPKEIIRSSYINNNLDRPFLAMDCFIAVCFLSSHLTEALFTIYTCTVPILKVRLWLLDEG